MRLAGDDLIGPGGSHVHCESVNDFIYVKTQIPSGYNARKLIGEYPEAALGRFAPSPWRVNAIIRCSSRTMCPPTPHARVVPGSGPVDRR